MGNLLVFSQTFESLRRALGGEVDASLLDRFRAVGVDYDKPLLPAYPYEVWAQAMTLGAEALFPDASTDERAYRLGKLFLDSYSASLVGKALLALLRVVGPRRTLERMTRNLRTGNNYTETTLEADPAGGFRLTFNHVLVPQFYRGLVQRGIEVSGGKGAEVTIVSHVGEVGVFRVTWDGASS